MSDTEFNTHCLRPGFFDRETNVEMGFGPVYHPHFIRQSRLESVDLECEGKISLILKNRALKNKGGLP